MSDFPLDRDALKRRILTLQDREGRIAWVDAGLWDPWNQVEAAMGLAVAGEVEAAARALDHLAQTQGPSGAWSADMGCAAPMTADNERLVPDAPQIVDTNFAAYCAVGVWHVAQIDGGTRLLERYAPMIEAALGFVLDHQRSDGAIAWRAREPGESADDVDALPTASAAIYKALECAIRTFDALGRPTTPLRAARARLGAAIRDNRPERWRADGLHAMDWYYPVLAGAVRGAGARARLAAGWRRHVMREGGCRCMSNEPWVTAAETAELAMTLAAVGAGGLAVRTLKSLALTRDETGGAWMGWQHVEQRPWPRERPSWTAGAALLADDVVRNASPGAAVFLDVLDEET